MSVSLVSIERQAELAAKFGASQATIEAFQKGSKVDRNTAVDEFLRIWAYAISQKELDLQDLFELSQLVF